MRTSSLILCGFVMLLSMSVGLSWGAEPESMLPGPGGNPADIDREVLWLDNPDFAELVGSSEVMGEYGFWTEIANDFLLEANVTVRKVAWWGVYWNDYDGIPTGSGFNLRFYVDLANLPEDTPFADYLLPGNDCCETLAAGGDQYSHFVYEYCLDLSLAPGIYWFSVQMADHAFPPQWGRLGADMTLLWDSMFRSPYFSYPEWIVASEFFGIFGTWDASQMFEDDCEATAIESASWGAVKDLFR